MFRSLSKDSKTDKMLFSPAVNDHYK